MFKKLKEKITEEVKSSPQRLQQFLQQQQQQQNSTAVTDENFFTLSEDDAGAAASNMEPGFANVSLRRNSNSSIASDVSFLPRYEATSSDYHLQSDFDVSASEMEDNASTSSQLGHLSKEQIYSAFQKAQRQHHKYRGRYVDLARHYKELERENGKMKAVLVETQDKAIRRVAELKEQCNLEQKAKAHLENALRVELDEKQYKIETLQTQIGLLQQNSHSISQSEDVETNKNDEDLLRKDLNDARIEIESLNAKLQENKANSIVFQSKENDYKNKIANLEKEIAQHVEREKENNVKFAQNKMELHNQLIAKDAEIVSLKAEIETLKDNKTENLQAQNRKLIEKVEELTRKCNNFESDLLKLEQYKIEIKTLQENLAEVKRRNAEILEEKQREFDEEKRKLEEDFGWKLAEQREAAKKSLLSLESRVKEQVATEFAEKEDKIRVEFLQKMDSLTSNQDQLKEVQMKLFEQQDLTKTLEEQNRTLNERLLNLQQKYKDLEDNHLQLIQEASEQRATVANLNKELEETKNTNANFEGEVARLTANLKKLEDLVANVRSEKQRLVEEKKQMESALEESKCRFDSERANLNAELEKISVELELLQKEKGENVVEFQEEILGLKQEKEELANKYEQMSLQSHDLKTQLEELTEKYAEQNNKLQEVENRYLNVLDENQNLKENAAEIEDLQKTIDQLHNFKMKCEETCAENETLTVRTAELESKLRDYEEEFENLSKQLTVSRDDFAKTTSDLQEEIATLKRENEQLKMDLQKESDRLKAELSEVHKRNAQLVADNKVVSDENSELLSELSEMKIRLDLAQVEVNNYKEIADKIASEKQLLLEEMNNLRVEFEKEHNVEVDVEGLKARIEEVLAKNEELKKEVERSEGFCREREDLQGQLRELEHQYNEIVHEKQLLQDEVQELKTAPLNLNENKKLDDLNILKTENSLNSKNYEDEINQLHEKLIQYQSMDLTNKSSIEFYQNELEKLKLKNEKLNRKLDETLVTLNHCAELSNSTEIEYLRNVLFNYMLGKESMVLARVIAAVCKFDEHQTEMILQKEQQKQSLLGQLGIL